jgi:hypothetical protein
MFQRCAGQEDAKPNWPPGEPWTNPLGKETRGFLGGL